MHEADNDATNVGDLVNSPPTVHVNVDNATEEQQENSEEQKENTEEQQDSSNDNIFEDNVFEDERMESQWELPEDFGTRLYEGVKISRYLCFFV